MRALPHKHHVLCSVIPLDPFSCTLCYALYILFCDVFVEVTLLGLFLWFLHVCFLALYYSIICSSCFAFVHLYSYNLCNYLRPMLLCTCYCCCIPSSHGSLKGFLMPKSDYWRSGCHPLGGFPLNFFISPLSHAFILGILSCFTTPLAFFSGRGISLVVDSLNCALNIAFKTREFIPQEPRHYLPTVPTVSY